MPHFDFTVTLGNVLVMAAFALAAINYGLKTDFDVKRNKEDLAAIKEWIKGHKLCNDKQVEILDELRGAMEYLRGLQDAKNLMQSRSERHHD